MLGISTRASLPDLRTAVYPRSSNLKHKGWWLDTHRRYFARLAAREGFELDDDILTVFERFVWPLDVTDLIAEELEPSNQRINLERRAVRHIRQVFEH